MAGDAEARIIIRGDASGAQAAADKTRSALVRVKDTLAPLKTAFAGLSAAAGMAFGVKWNAQMEQAQIAFTAMLGSAERAKAFLEEMVRFAARTPFELPQVQEGARRLLAFGFAAKDVIPTLRSVGDAASGLGIGAEGINRIILALGQMKAKAKVSAQEMLQLTEAGVPAWDILAKAIGKSTAETMKLAEKGVIPADKAIQALIAGMEQRFPNMMAQQSKTLIGLFSTLKDNLSMILGQVMEPFTNRLKDIMPKLVDWTTQIQERLKSGDLRQALEGAMAAATELGRGLALIGKFLWEHKNLVAAALATWASFRALNIGQTIFGTMIPLIARAISNLRGFTLILAEVPGLLGKVRAALMLLTSANPILLGISAAVGLITLAILKLNAHLHKVGRTWADVWSSIKIEAVRAVDFLLRAIRPVAFLFHTTAAEIDSTRASLQRYAAVEQAAMGDRRNRLEAVRAAEERAKLATDAGTQASLAAAQASRDYSGAAAGLAGTLGGATTPALDRLDLALEVSKQKLQTATAQLGANATEAQKLALTKASLAEQLGIVNQRVALLTAEYEKMKAAKGATAAETQKLYLELLREQEAQAGLQVQIQQTTQQLEAQKRITLEVAGAMVNLDLSTPGGRAVFQASGHNYIPGMAGERPSQQQTIDYRKEVERRLGPEGAKEWLKIHPTPFALGGIVTRPTLAMIGERGPEAVIPLDRAGIIRDNRPMTVILQVDGRELTRAMLRYMPGEVARAGAVF